MSNRLIFKQSYLSLLLSSCWQLLVFHWDPHSFKIYHPSQFAADFFLCLGLF